MTSSFDRTGTIEVGAVIAVHDGGADRSWETMSSDNFFQCACGAGGGTGDHIGLEKRFVLHMCCCVCFPYFVRSFCVHRYEEEGPSCLYVCRMTAEGSTSTRENDALGREFPC